MHRALHDSIPGLVIAATVSMLALPSAVLAFSNTIETNVSPVMDHPSSVLTTGLVVPTLTAAAQRSIMGRFFRFTLAGLAAHRDQSVMVVQRIDHETSRTFIIHTTPTVRSMVGTSLPLNIVPTAYSLGRAHGYRGFVPLAQNLASPVDSHQQELPYLQSYSLPSDDATSRLAPRMQLARQGRAGRAPLTLESAGEQSLDVGGSYHVNHHLDVTAGVRYADDRDRIQPVGNVKQDSQAVFVGTQFHF